MDEAQKALGTPLTGEVIEALVRANEKETGRVHKARRGEIDRQAPEQVAEEFVRTAQEQRVRSNC